MFECGSASSVYAGKSVSDSSGCVCGSEGSSESGDAGGEGAVSSSLDGEASGCADEGNAESGGALYGATDSSEAGDWSASEVSSSVVESVDAAE